MTIFSVTSGLRVESLEAPNLSQSHLAIPNSPSEEESRERKEFCLKCLKTMAEREEAEASEAFKALFEEFAPRLAISLELKSKGLNSQDSEDIVSISMMKLWKSRENFTAKSAQEAHSYLYAVATNCMIDHLRSKSSQPLVLQAAMQDENQPSSILNQSDPALSPDQKAINSEESQILTELLGRLPPIQRKVQELHLAGYIQTEIAEKLDLPHGTVKSHLRLGREKLTTFSPFGQEIPTTKKFKSSLENITLSLKLADEKVLRNFAKYAVLERSMSEIAREDGVHVKSIELQLRPLRKTCEFTQGRGHISPKTGFLILHALNPGREKTEPLPVAPAPVLSREEFDFLIEKQQAKTQELLRLHYITRVPLAQVSQESGLSKKELARKFASFIRKAKELKGNHLTIGNLEVHEQVDSEHPTGLRDIEKLKVRMVVRNFSEKNREILKRHLVEGESLKDIHSKDRRLITNSQLMIRTLKKSIGAALAHGIDKTEEIQAVVNDELIGRKAIPERQEVFTASEWRILMRQRNDLHRTISERGFVHRQSISEIAEEMNLTQNNVKNSLARTLNHMHLLRGYNDFKRSSVLISDLNPPKTNAFEPGAENVFQLKIELLKRTASDTKRWLEKFFLKGESVADIAEGASLEKWRIRNAIGAFIQKSRCLNGEGRFVPEVLKLVVAELADRKIVL